MLPSPVQRSPHRDTRPNAGSRPRLVLLAVVAVLLAGTAAPLAGGGVASAAATPSGTEPVTEPVSEPPAPRALGTVTDGPPGPCVEGFDCTGFTVTDCPDLPGPLGGTYAVARPATAPRGVAVFLSGGGGKDWLGLGPQGPNAAGTSVQQLVAEGFVVVQLSWAEPGWLTSPAGEALGPAAVACRPATALRHLHDTLFAPLALPEEAGVCGFCAFGVSGGASAIAYSLTAYGLDSVVDVAVLGSGPPHGAVHRGCLGEPGYSYSAANRANIDRSYGFGDAVTTGACRLSDPSLAGTWAADSVEAAGNDYLLETTRVELVFGSEDDPIIPAHSRAFADALVAAGTVRVEEQTVRGAGHALSNDGPAMRVVSAELLDGGETVTGPDVVVTAPQDGAVYDEGADVLADFACVAAEGAPPVASCTGTVAPGTPVDTSVARAHRFTVEAVDEAGTATTRTVTYAVRAPGPRVLLVIGSTRLRSDDAKLRNRLIGDLGATVTVRDDEAAEDVTGHDVVVLSDSVDPLALKSRYQRAPVGVVALDAALWDDLGLATQEGTSAQATMLAVAEAEHPLADELGRTSRAALTATTSSAPFTFVHTERLGRGAARVLSIAKAPDRVVDAGYEAGAMLASGRAAAGRRVALGITGPAVTRLTAEGWVVLDNAVAWAASG